LRRSGYQTPHVQAGFRTVLRGRSNSAFRRSGSYPSEYVLPNIVNSGRSVRVANGPVLRSGRTTSMKVLGSGLSVRSAMPRGSFRSSYTTASIPAL
jgi:hypothetical protein